MSDALLNAPQEKIEILPVSLLDEQRPLVNDLKHLAHSLGLEFGWHYQLDLSWIISQLGQVRGKWIMDAGAGTGIMQWYLAEKGAQVLSVDRGSRANLPLRFRHRFNIEGMRDKGRSERGVSAEGYFRREQDLTPSWQVIRENLKGGNKLPPARLSKRIFAQGKEISTAVWSTLTVKPASGKVILYNQGLKCLPEVADGSVDAVVAVSSLEHNQPEDLETVIAELMRTLKPGGLLLATLCATGGEDWFHKPSAGWCYNEASLRRIFGLAGDTPSNYTRYSELLATLVNCSELRDNLASFYFKSGDNGMPWGKWEPQYLPVGVCKIKR
jgi:ubiquinone/menaquinone biosynthesis C-methylase UbiE